MGRNFFLNKISRTASSIIFKKDNVKDVSERAFELDGHILACIVRRQILAKTAMIKPVWPTRINFSLLPLLIHNMSLLTPCGNINATDGTLLGRLLC
jgi:hypothetical protein